MDLTVSTLLVIIFEQWVPLKIRVGWSRFTRLKCIFIIIFVDQSWYCYSWSWCQGGRSFFFGLMGEGEALGILFFRYCFCCFFFVSFFFRFCFVVFVVSFFFYIFSFFKVLGFFITEFWMRRWEFGDQHKKEYRVINSELISICFN